MMWTTRAARPRMAPAVRSRVSTSPSCSAITHLLTSSRMWFSEERQKRGTVNKNGETQAPHLLLFQLWKEKYIYVCLSTNEWTVLVCGNEYLCCWWLILCDSCFSMNVSELLWIQLKQLEFIWLYCLFPIEKKKKPSKIMSFFYLISLNTIIKYQI